MANNYPFFPPGPPPLPVALPPTTTDPARNNQIHPAVSQAQQAAFQQNAQLPGINANALLQSISPEQLAMIAQMIQNGQIQLPAPSQVANVPVSQSQITNAHSEPSVVPAQRSVAPVPPHAMDIDKEEGELDEDETPEDKGRNGPMQQRTNTARQHNSSMQHERRDRRYQSPARNGKHRMASPPRSQPPAQRRAVSGKKQVDKKSAANAFVLQMHKVGYTFEDLAPFADSRLLRRTFNDLDLPVAVKAKAASTQVQTNGNGTPAAQQPGPSTRLGLSVPSSQAVVASPSTEVRSASGAKRVAPVRPAAATTVDRSDYLARLQAAKNKKAEVSTSTKPAASPNVQENPRPAEPLTVATGPPTIAEPATTTPTSAAPVSQKKITVNTALVKERLEALRAKAAQAAKTNPSSDSEFPAEQIIALALNQPGLDFLPKNPLRAKFSGAGLAEIAEQATREPDVPSSPTPEPVLAPEATKPTNATPKLPRTSMPTASLPPPPPPSLPYNGLPGLSLSGSPFQSSMPGFHLPGLGSVPMAPVAAPAPSTEARPLANTASLAASSPPATQTQIHIPRTRPAATDFYVYSPAPADLPKKPFGPAREDRVVIEASEDEESDSELDEGVEEEVAPRPQPPKSIVLPGLDSASATPGSTTPGGTPLLQKMSEIEILRKKIKEAELRQLKANRTATPAQQKNASVSDTVASISAQDTPLETTASVAASIASADAHSAPEAASGASQSTNSLGNQELFHQKQRAEYDLAGLRQNGTVEHSKTEQSSSSDSESEMDIDESESESESEKSAADEEDELATTETNTGLNHDDFQDAAARSDQQIAEVTSSSAASTKEASITATQNLPELSTEAGENGKDESDDSSVEADDNYDTDTFLEESDEYEPQPFPEHEDTGNFDATKERESSSDEESDAPAMQLSQVPRHSVVDDMDIAPEVQASRQEQIETQEPDSAPKTYYTEYISPLAVFKDYRYHPEFLAAVPGGFRSLTYSNRIDPMNQVCRFEAVGGVCNDPSCDNQHFKNMKLTDNELLAELGTKNTPVRTSEDDQRWKAGLSKVVQQLKKTIHARDVDAIAAHIAQYRRDFVGSPDKVLNLKF